MVRPAVAEPVAPQPTAASAGKPAAKPAAKKPTATGARSRAKATTASDPIETLAASNGAAEVPVRKPRARAARKPAEPAAG